jgi:flagellar hook protein FlgE
VAADPAMAAFQIQFQTDPALGRPGAIRSVVQAGPTALAAGFPYDFGLPDTPPTPTAWIVDQPTNPLNGFLTITPPGGGAIDIRLGAIDDDTGLSQLSAPSQVLAATKNGSPASALAGVEIDETGLVDAIYDSGFRQTLYKVPVANVQNPNGMRALDGQAFQAGTGPTGPLVSSALEESTTDVAEELTQLIKTQRAYSSNAKIIQTVDEMLQETTNLKR